MSDPSASSSGPRLVSATRAVRSFGTILARVREEGAVYVVERSGKPVAQIGPVEDRVFTMREFAELARSHARAPVGEVYLRAVEEGIAFLNRPEIPESPWES